MESENQTEGGGREIYEFSRNFVTTIGYNTYIHRVNVIIAHRKKLHTIRQFK